MEKPKVILVTGSSRGIGAGLVINFARKGYKVVINYSKSDGEANQLYREIRAFAGSNMVMLMKADVSKRIEVKDMFDRIVANFGRIDALINNAGINIEFMHTKVLNRGWYLSDINNVYSA